VNGYLSTVKEAIEAWEVGELSTEKAYQNQLAAFLVEATPDDARVEKEYRVEGTTADMYLKWKGIVFEDELFFELKRNLKSKAAYDRLVGQVEGLNPDKRKIAVVLFGAVEQQYVERLKEHYADKLNQEGMVIVTKP